MTLYQKLLQITESKTSAQKFEQIMVAKMNTIEATKQNLGMTLHKP